MVVGRGSYTEIRSVRHNVEVNVDHRNVDVRRSVDYGNVDTRRGTSDTICNGNYKRYTMCVCVYKKERDRLNTMTLLMVEEVRRTTSEWSTPDYL